MDTNTVDLTDTTEAAETAHTGPTWSEVFYDITHDLSSGIVNFLPEGIFSRADNYLYAQKNNEDTPIKAKAASIAYTATHFALGTSHLVGDLVGKVTGYTASGFGKILDRLISAPTSNYATQNDLILNRKIGANGKMLHNLSQNTVLPALAGSLASGAVMASGLVATAFTLPAMLAMGAGLGIVAFNAPSYLNYLNPFGKGKPEAAPIPDTTPPAPTRSPIASPVITPHISPVVSPVISPVVTPVLTPIVTPPVTPAAAPVVKPVEIPEPIETPIETVTAKAPTPITPALNTEKKKDKERPRGRFRAGSITKKDKEKEKEKEKKEVLESDSDEVPEVFIPRKKDTVVRRGANPK